MTGPRWTRRRFLKIAAASGAAVAWPGAALRGARGRDDLIRVGLLVPDAGPGAAAGRAASRGAELGAAEASRLAELLGRGFEVVARPAAPGALGRETRELVEGAGVAAIVGGVDEPSCLALAEAAERHGILFLNVGCADDAFRGEGCGRHAFHVDASTAMYADAFAQWLAGERRLRRWQFVAAGPAEAAAARRARRALLEEGGEDAGAVEFRPGAAGEALRAIRRARSDVVLVALRGEARKEFLRAFAGAGLPVEAACLFPGDRPPWSRPAETRVGVWPVLWHPGLFRYGAEQLNDRFSDRFGEPLESRAWAAWMAMKIVAETALRSRADSPAEWIDYLEGRRAQFDGHKGRPLTFRRWNHQLRQPVYLVRVRPEEDAHGAFEHVAELPLGAPAPGESSETFLDRLGDGPDETSCRFGV